MAVLQVQADAVSVPHMDRSTISPQRTAQIIHMQVDTRTPYNRPPPTVHTIGRPVMFSFYGVLASHVYVCIDKGNCARLTIMMELMYYLGVLY